MVKNEIVDCLLQINAIKLNPANPFTWASGWKSPIYCDNRKTLSFPKARNIIRDEFVKIIKRKYPKVDVIAGVATGAIAHGILVAEALNLPFVYVRSTPKNHGLENLVEGELTPNQKVVVVEDLISTGQSSLNAVEALQKAKCEVLGMVAIFTYGFKQAEVNFDNAKVNLDTLANYGELIHIAVANNYVSENQIELLKSWREQPESWGK